MVRERVDMAVGATYTVVDCRFVFHNDGPACSVRMGFPDEGDGSYQTDVRMSATDADSPPPKTGVPYTCFYWFHSFVDGKPVPTHPVWAKEKEGLVISWHTKTVHFAAGQTRVVRDRYKQGSGMAAALGTGYIGITYYTMHTGSSWKGRIGDAIVRVHFLDRRGPMHPISLLTLPRHFYDDVRTWPDRSSRGVYYAGFARPTVLGKTLVFHARNLKPTDSDDIALYYMRTSVDRMDWIPSSKHEHPNPKDRPWAVICSDLAAPPIY
jgi:hypothetical protein